MAQLYNVDSPITREQRNNLNATFEDIQIRLSNLRYQMSLLSGGQDLEIIFQRIEDAITEANNSTSNVQQVLDDISDALNQLSAALQNSNNATDNANNAATNAQNEILNVQNYVNQLGNAESYDNNKTYSKNNIVEYNGSSFIALQQTTGNAPPSLPLKQNDFWHLLAQRGVDGEGSVSSVNNKNPDVNGNIDLIPSDIGAATETELTNLSQNFSALNTDFTTHLQSFEFRTAFSRDTSMIGLQKITLPFSAEALIVCAWVEGKKFLSNVYYDKTTGGISGYAMRQDGLIIGHSNLVKIDDGQGNIFEANLQSNESDGINLYWLKTGDPNDTVTVSLLALKHRGDY